MRKRILLIILAVTLTLSFVNLNLAIEKGNGRKGKYLFRKNCRSCHSESASAMELSPISKTQTQWLTIFAKDKYPKLSCATEWEKRSDKDLLDMFTYMYDHAFDSPSPLKCK